MKKCLLVLNFYLLLFALVGCTGGASRNYIISDEHGPVVQTESKESKNDNL